MSTSEEKDSMRDQINVTVNQIVAKFQEHPKSVGKTYTGHFVQSMYFSMCSLASSLIFCLHAVFPFLFEKTGGDLVNYVQSLLVDVPVPCCVEPPKPLDNNEEPGEPPVVSLQDVCDESESDDSADDEETPAEEETPEEESAPVEEETPVEEAAAPVDEESAPVETPAVPVEEMTLEHDETF